MKLSSIPGVNQDWTHASNKITQSYILLKKYPEKYPQNASKLFFTPVKRHKRCESKRCREMKLENERKKWRTIGKESIFRTFLALESFFQFLRSGEIRVPRVEHNSRDLCVRVVHFCVYTSQFTSHSG